MTRTSLVDGRLMTRLNRFFPDTVTIQRNTPTTDAEGGLVNSWANLTDHVSLAM